MNLQSNHLFSGKQLVTQAPGLLGHWAGITVWVSRAACVYVRLDARGIPWHKRSAFVQLQLPTHALYAHTGYFASYANDYVHVWLWDQSALEAAAGLQSLPVQRLRCIPESARYRYKDTLAELLACPDLVADPSNGGHENHPMAGAAMPAGFEGLLWRPQGQGKCALADNCWWPVRPDAGQWARFADNSLAAAAPPSLTKQAVAAYGTRVACMPCLARGVVQHGAVSNVQGLWQTKAHGDPSGVKRLPWLAMCWMLGALALCANAAGVLQQWRVLEQAKVLVSPAAPAKAPATDTLRPVEMNRDAGPTTNKEAMLAAIAANEEASASARYFAGPDLLLLWDYLATPFVREGVRLREFDLRAGELRMVLASAKEDMNLPQVLAMLEACPMLKDVGVEPTQNLRELRVKATPVVPSHAHSVMPREMRSSSTVPAVGLATWGAAR